MWTWTFWWVRVATRCRANRTDVEAMVNRARYPSLRGKVVFITGGGTGIGEYLVKAFCNQGSAVAFVDIKEAESHELCDTVESQSGSRPLFIPCDLRNIDALRAAVEKTRQVLGNIAALLNNAADDTRHDFDRVTVEFWDDRMAVNLRHAFFSAQAVYPQMKELGHGSIVNFGSMSWMAKQGGMPGYTTSKAALHGLTCGLARDFGADNIRVNTLVPGWVMTQRQLDHCVDEETEKTIQANQCLARRLMPDDIANMAMFLSADDSAMITGQSFIVDGGWV